MEDNQFEIQALVQWVEWKKILKTKFSQQEAFNQLQVDGKIPVQDNLQVVFRYLQKENIDQTQFNEMWSTWDDKLSEKQHFEKLQKEKTLIKQMLETEETIQISKISKKKEAIIESDTLKDISIKLERMLEFQLKNNKIKPKYQGGADLFNNIKPQHHNELAELTINKFEIVQMEERKEQIDIEQDSLKKDKSIHFLKQNENFKALKFEKSASSLKNTYLTQNNSQTSVSTFIKSPSKKYSNPSSVFISPKSFLSSPGPAQMAKPTNKQRATRRDQFLKVHNLKADLDDFLNDNFQMKERERDQHKYFSLSPRRQIAPTIQKGGLDSLIDSWTQQSRQMKFQLDFRNQNNQPQNKKINERIQSIRQKLHTISPKDSKKIKENLKGMKSNQQAAIQYNKKQTKLRSIQQDDILDRPAQIQEISVSEVAKQTPNEISVEQTPIETETPEQSEQ